MNWKNLEKEATQLEALGEQINVAETALSKYKNLVEKTVEVNHKIEAVRSNMNAAADAYMKNCFTYLGNQNERMESEISSGNTNMARHHKITIVNDIIDAGNAVRVANFKGQALREPNTLKTAVKEFENSFSYFNELRKDCT